MGQGGAQERVLSGVFTTDKCVLFRSQLKFIDPMVIVKSGGVNVHSSWIRIFSPSDY